MNIFHPALYTRTVSLKTGKFLLKTITCILQCEHQTYSIIIRHLSKKTHYQIPYYGLSTLYAICIYTIIVANSIQVSEPLKERLEADGVMVFEKIFNSDEGVQSLGDEPLVSHILYYTVQQREVNETYIVWRKWQPPHPGKLLLVTSKVGDGHLHS